MKEKIKLSQYAKEQNIPYKKIWDAYSNGALPVKTEVSKTGRVSVIREAKASITDVNASFGKMAVPMSPFEKTYEATASTTRRNKAATSTPTDEYYWIKNGLNPFNLSNNNINCNEAIRLCQLAFYNFSIVANTINLMTEFSTNKLYLREGNAKSKKFFTDWFETINILDLQDKFFRELYRSSNVFIYRFDTEIGETSTLKLNEAYLSEAAKNTKLPISYIILNPADINVGGNVLFSKSSYFKLLNSYEIGRLRKPQTPEEQKFFDGLDPEIKKQITSGSTSVLLPLDPEQISVIFYKKQDYEPMAIPTIYSVLKDLNFKAELRHIDQAVSRTMQNVVLLIKMGYESKNGDYMFDQNAANAMKELFASESASKVLVADFTTDVKYAIPTIGDFLDPKKYQIVNEDIKTGLNHILSGSNDTKFANQYIQVQLFIQRLQQARELFLNKFLIPEMKRISESMKFKAIPVPYFEDIDLKDTSEFDRIVAQLYQYGLLTPGETFEALETGRIPTGDESALAQEEFKKQRDKGFYEPITGGPATQKAILDKTNTNQLKVMDKQQEHDNKMKTKELKHKAENPEAPAPQIVLNAPTKMAQPKGKPAGKAGPNSKKRSSKPMKANLNEEIEQYKEQYSLSKIKDNIILAMELDKEIEKSLLEKHNLKKLNEEQTKIKNEIQELIIANQEPENWKKSVSKYIENPIHDNQKRLDEIDKISYNHQISNYLASILVASKK